MGKYLLLWEIDPTRVPVDRKERAAAWGSQIELVKQDIQKGLTKDMGAFVGELNGYSVVEGTEVEIANLTSQYPFTRFKTHAVASVSQIEEFLKTLAG